MTDRNLGFSFSWWIGKVVSVKDPDQSGRVQVRIFGRHDDLNGIPDADLPWAMPLQPVTSAAIGKVGTTPLGLLKDSKVVGFWADADQQYPIIFGSFGKSGDPIPGQNADGSLAIDIKTGSIPAPAVNQSDPVEWNAFSKLYPARVDINQINNQGADPTIGKFTIQTGIVNKKEVDKKLKEPTKPTTASVDKNDTKDIIDNIKSVDPTGLSRSLPGMTDGFKTVRDVMSLTSIGGLTNMLTGSLTNVIKNLAGTMGIGNALGMMNGALQSGNITGIAQSALKLAVAAVTVEAALNNGIVSKSAPPVIPTVNPAKGRPPASQIVTTVPPNYVQQYYTVQTDPYPGYIQYMDPKTKAVVYTLRGTQPLYASAQDHIMANGTSSIQNALIAVTAGNAVSKLLGGGSSQIGSAASLVAGLASGNAISAAINGGLAGIAAQGISSVLGHGINLNNILSNVSSLLPNIAKNITGLMSGHLPSSVLNAGSIGNAMSDFTKNQALLSVKKDSMASALAPQDPDAALKAANARLAASEIAKNGPAPGSSEVINYNGENYKVTYTATGSNIVKQ